MKGAKKVVQEQCEEIEATLRRAGFRVYFDNTDRRPGDKYYIWEMRGVPLRLEIGNREVKNNTATIFRRDIRTRDTVSVEKLVQVIRKFGKALTKELFRRAEVIFYDAIQNADTFEEICEVIESKKVARINFCTIELEGESCAERVKEATGADVRGTKLGEDEKPWGPCPLCNEPATVVAYVGRSY